MKQLKLLIKYILIIIKQKYEIIYIRIMLYVNVFNNSIYTMRYKLITIGFYIISFALFFVLFFI